MEDIQTGMRVSSILHISFNQAAQLKWKKL